MTTLQTVGVVGVAVILLFGLVGPQIMLWHTNRLVDRYQAILDEHEKGEPTP